MLWLLQSPSDYLKLQIMDHFGPSEVGEASNFIACSKQIDSPESLQFSVHVLQNRKYSVLLAPSWPDSLNSKNINFKFIESLGDSFLWLQMSGWSVLLSSKEVYSV